MKAYNVTIQDNQVAIVICKDGVVQAAAVNVNDKDFIKDLEELYYSAKQELKI